MVTMSMVNRGSVMLYESGSLESLALGGYGGGYYHLGLLKFADAKRTAHSHADPQRANQVLRPIRTA